MKNGFHSFDFQPSKVTSLLDMNLYFRYQTIHYCTETFSRMIKFVKWREFSAKMNTKKTEMSNIFSKISKSCPILKFIPCAIKWSQSGKLRNSSQICFWNFFFQKIQINKRSNSSIWKIRKTCRNLASDIWKRLSCGSFLTICHHDGHNGYVLQL